MGRGFGSVTRLNARVDEAASLLTEIPWVSGSLPWMTCIGRHGDHLVDESGLSARTDMFLPVVPSFLLALAPKPGLYGYPTLGIISVFSSSNFYGRALSCSSPRVALTIICVTSLKDEHCTHRPGRVERIQGVLNKTNSKGILTRTHVAY